MSRLREECFGCNKILPASKYWVVGFRQYKYCTRRCLTKYMKDAKPIWLLKILKDVQPVKLVKVEKNKWVRATK